MPQSAMGCSLTLAIIASIAGLTSIVDDDIVPLSCSDGALVSARRRLFAIVLTSQY
jgi:hypothetical protein